MAIFDITFNLWRFLFFCNVTVDSCKLYRLYFYRVMSVTRFIDYYCTISNKYRTVKYCTIPQRHRSSRNVADLLLLTTLCTWIYSLRLFTIKYILYFFFMNTVFSICFQLISHKTRSYNSTETKPSPRKKPVDIILLGPRGQPAGRPARTTRSR